MKIRLGGEKGLLEHLSEKDRKAAGLGGSEDKNIDELENEISEHAEAPEDEPDQPAA